jgi:hypothetical protein
MAAVMEIKVTDDNCVFRGSWTDVDDCLHRLQRKHKMTLRNEAFITGEWRWESITMRQHNLASKLSYSSAKFILEFNLALRHYFQLPGFLYVTKQINALPTVK